MNPTKIEIAFVMTNEHDDHELFPHLVIPGQIIAVTAATEDSFLRGHGTYLEHSSQGTLQQQQLRASVTGTVVRVNKLISVEPMALYNYMPQVGDLVVGRIHSIGNARWNVHLGSCNMIAALPLTGVHLPGSVQRVRTAADALEMRMALQENDLVSAEAHKVQVGGGGGSNGSLMLHTRSVRYGKLENGVVVTVPANLIPRRRTHYTTLCENRFQILLGCNGILWLQRNNNSSGSSTNNNNNESMISGGQHELAEAEEERRVQHAKTPYTLQDRRDLSRLQCAIQCLRFTLNEITPEAVQAVYDKSQTMRVPEMLFPENVVQLTSQIS